MNQFDPNFGMPLSPSDYFNPFLRQGTGMAGSSDPNVLSAQAMAMLGAQGQSMQQLRPGTDLGYGNFNFMGDPNLGQMLNMLTGQFVQSQGYTPFGTFGSPQSIMPALRNRAEMMQAQQAMIAAVSRDKSGVRTRLSGMFTTIAQATGASEDDAAAYGKKAGASISDLLVTPMGITFAQQIGGMLGVDIIGAVSPEAAMSGGLYRSTMTRYRGDGTFGMRPDELGRLNATLTDYFYPEGLQDMTRTRGFNARQLGNMAASLQSRGMLPVYTDAQDLSGSARDRYEELVKATPTGTGRAAALETVNAEAVKTKLQESTKVFKVAQELTGSKDIETLMQAIQGLTGRQLGTIDSNQVEQNLRKIQELVRAARISADQMIFLVQQGQDMANRAGLSSSVGGNIAMNTVERATIAAAVNQTQTGGVASAYRTTFDQQVAHEQQQTARAIQSPVFQRVAAATGYLARLDDNLGQGEKIDDRIKGLQAKVADGTASDEEKEALNTMQTLKRVQDGNATDADFETVALRQFSNKVVSAVRVMGFNVRSDTADSLEYDRVLADHGSAVNGNLISNIRALQPAEVRHYLRNSTNAMIASKAEELGLEGDTERQQELGRRLVELKTIGTPDTVIYKEKAKAIKEEFGLSSEQLATFNMDIGNRFTKLLQAQGLTTQADQNAFLAGTAATATGDLGDLRKAIESNVEVSRALSDIGIPEFMERLTQLLANPRSAEADGLQKGLMELLGGIPNEKIRDVLKGQITEAVEAKRQLDGTRTDQQQIDLNREQAITGTQAAIAAQTRDVKAARFAVLTNDPEQKAKAEEVLDRSYAYAKAVSQLTIAGTSEEEKKDSLVEIRRQATVVSDKRQQAYLEDVATLLDKTATPEMRSKAAERRGLDPKDQDSIDEFIKGVETNAAAIGDNVVGLRNRQKIANDAGIDSNFVGIVEAEMRTAESQAVTTERKAAEVEKEAARTDVKRVTETEQEELRAEANRKITSLQNVNQSIGNLAVQETTAPKSPEPTTQPTTADVVEPPAALKETASLTTLSEPKLTKTLEGGTPIRDAEGRVVGERVLSADKTEASVIYTKPINLEPAGAGEAPTDKTIYPGIRFDSPFAKQRKFSSLEEVDAYTRQIPEDHFRQNADEDQSVVIKRQHAFKEWMQAHTSKSILDTGNALGLYSGTTDRTTLEAERRAVEIAQINEPTTEAATKERETGESRSIISRIIDPLNLTGADSEGSRSILDRVIDPLDLKNKKGIKSGALDVAEGLIAKPHGILKAILDPMSLFRGSGDSSETGSKTLAPVADADISPAADVASSSTGVKIAKAESDDDAENTRTDAKGGGKGSNIRVNGTVKLMLGDAPLGNALLEMLENSKPGFGN